MTPPNREQFVQQVIDVVKDKFPAAKVARAEQAFSLKVNGQVASLENIYRSSVLQPEQATAFIQEWMLEIIRASEGQPDLEASFKELSERIMPMILREDMTSEAKAIACQPLVAGLVVAYAVDSQRSIWYVSQETAQKWQVSVDKLHETAMENLVSRSQAIAAHAAQDPDGGINLILFQTMDGFDAARILLPTLHDRLREHLGSPFAAGIPNRDILLCFRDDEETVDRLRQQIATDYLKMPHPVTDRLLLITQDGIAPHE